MVVFTPTVEKPFGTLALANEEQTGIANLFSGYLSEEPILRGDALVAQIREDIPFVHFVDPQVVSNYELYKRIRTLLEGYGVDIPRTAHTGASIGRRVITAIYGNNRADCDKALTIFEAIRRGDYLPSPTASMSRASPFAREGDDEPANRIRNAEVQFENKLTKVFAATFGRGKKFSGAFEEDWGQFLAQYQKVCSECRVRPGEKVEYLHHILDGEALQFYYRDVDGKEANWGRVCQLFNNTFSSPTKMEKMSDRLRVLHISKFEGEGLPEDAALRRLFGEIERLSPMAHPEDRTSRAMRMCLQNGVGGRDWARDVDTSRLRPDTTYLDYRGMLSNAQQKWALHADASASFNDRPLSFRQPRWSNTAKVNYAGQARLGRTVENASTAGKFKPCDAKFCVLKDMVCLNCEKTGCRISNCKEQRNFERIAKNKVLSFACPHRNRRANVSFAETLHELSNELNEVLFCSENENLAPQGPENPEDDGASQCFNTGFVTTEASKVQEDLDHGAIAIATVLDDFDADDDEEGF